MHSTISRTQNCGTKKEAKDFLNMHRMHCSKKRGWSEIGSSIHYTKNTKQYTASISYSIDESLVYHRLSRY